MKYQSGDILHSFTLISPIKQQPVEVQALFKGKTKGWYMRCECGSFRVYEPSHVKTGRITSCGCKRGANIQANRDHTKGNDKRRQTTLQKYGVENVSQLAIIREANSAYQADNNSRIVSKARETLMQRYGVSNPGQTASSKEKQQLQGKYHIVAETGQTLKAWHEQHASDVAYGHLREMVANTEPLHEARLKEAVAFMRDKGSSLEKQFQLLTGLEIFGKSSLSKTFRKFDFKVSDNLYINVDGLWAHCERRREDGYHEKIRLQAEAENVRLIQFRENEIRDKAAIVLSMTRHAQGLSTQKYNARQLEIRKVGYVEGINFFNESHIMGYASAQYYGLYTKEGVLVSCMGVILTQDGTLDIKRFANKLNSSVRGGLSKLLKYVETLYSPKRVLYWVDLRYGQGNSLLASGFVKANNDEKSFSWTDGTITKHRLAFNEKTAAENKFYKIWDAGQRKLVKQLK